MILLVEILCTAVVLVLAYKWYKNRRIAEGLRWLPHVPGLPILGALLEFGNTTETIYDIERFVKKYGKAITLEVLTEPFVIITDYEFVEFVLGTHQVLSKSSDYEFLENWLGTGLLTSGGSKWKARRRMITPAFHFSILEQFVENFELNGRILIEQLGKEVDKESVDIYPYINLYTLDIICETAMGVSVNAQKSKDSSYVTQVKEMCRIAIDRGFSLFKRSNFFYRFSRDYYKEQKAVKELHSVTYSVIDARRQELENKGNVDGKKDEVGRKRKLAFLDILLQSTIDGKPLSREDIREEVDTFMFEGHDTTSSAISFILLMLAKHPEVQKRAVEEQTEIFHDDIHRAASYNDLQQMKYLELVIKESLRLYPSVPVIGRSTNEVTKYKGNTIPAGVDFLVFIYGVLRDPDNFPDPEKFDPARFESNEGTRPYNFIPFSAGPRNCIGQKFAMLELKSTLSKVLRNFELLPTVPEEKVILVSEAVLKSKNGIRIKLAKRKW